MKECLFFVILGIFCLGCGVKGKPLPPSEPPHLSGKEEEILNKKKSKN